MQTSKAVILAAATLALPCNDGAHRVTADDRGNAWVRDPRAGRLLVIHDTYPASGG